MKKILLFIGAFLIITINVKALTIENDLNCPYNVCDIYTRGEEIDWDGWALYFNSEDMEDNISYEVSLSPGLSFSEDSSLLTKSYEKSIFRKGSSPNLYLEIDPIYVTNTCSYGLQSISVTQGDGTKNTYYVGVVDFEADGNLDINALLINKGTKHTLQLTFNNTSDAFVYEVYYKAGALINSEYTNTTSYADKIGNDPGRVFNISAIKTKIVPTVNLTKEPENEDIMTIDGLYPKETITITYSNLSEEVVNNLGEVIPISYPKNDEEDVEREIPIVVQNIPVDMELPETVQETKDFEVISGGYNSTFNKSKDNQLTYVIELGTKTFNVFNSENLDDIEFKVYLDGNKLTYEDSYIVDKYIESAANQSDKKYYYNCNEKDHCLLVDFKDEFINDLTTGTHEITFWFKGNEVLSSTLNVIAVANPVFKDYKFIEGANTVFNRLKSNKLVFKVDADLDDFSELYLNDKYVSKKYYTLTKGSTVVTFNENFTDEITNGSYKLTAVYSDGVATTEFAVNNAEIDNPNTGAFISSLVLLPCLLVGMVLLRNKKKLYKI